MLKTGRRRFAVRDLFHAYLSAPPAHRLHSPQPPCHPSRFFESHPFTGFISPSSGKDNRTDYVLQNRTDQKLSTLATPPFDKIASADENARREVV